MVACLLQPRQRDRAGRHGSELLRCDCAFGIAEQEHLLAGFARSEHERHRQRGAGVQPGAAALAEMVGQHQTATRVEQRNPGTLRRLFEDPSARPLWDEPNHSIWVAFAGYALASELSTSILLDADAAAAPPYDPDAVSGPDPNFAGGDGVFGGGFDGSGFGDDGGGF